jgi:hypothetical protein
MTLSQGARFKIGTLFFLAGRIANPPWGVPLRSRIYQSGGLAMIVPIFETPPHASLDGKRKTH